MESPTTVLERPVAKKKAPESRKDMPVRIDTDAIDAARIVAAYRKVPISEYMSQAIREIAKRDHAKILAKLKTPTPADDE